MNQNGDEEDSMSFLLNLLSNDNQQDEPMTDTTTAYVQQQQQQHSEPTALEDIEPSLDLLQYPPVPISFEVPPSPSPVFSTDGAGAAGVGNSVNSVQWQPMPQQQDPLQTGSSAFQQYRNHSSCSSYSNFSSSVPSVASTPSLLSGFSTPAHPREWARGGAYGAGSSIQSSAVAVVSLAVGSGALAIDPDENRRRFADVNSLSRQELYDTISSRLMRVGSGSSVGFGVDSASPSAAYASDTPDSPRWQQQQQPHHHHRHHHSGGSASASSAASIVGVGASAASVVDSGDVDYAAVGGGAHLKDEPATPPSTPSRLPRHQREPHKKAEKKRVEKIRQRLDQLRELCGSGGGADRSEAKLLSRVLAYLRDLQTANRRAGDEAAMLQTRLAELEAEQKRLLEALNDKAEGDATIDEGFGAVKLESDHCADEDADMASENTITHDYRHQLGSQVALQQRQQQQQLQQQDQAVRLRQSEADSLSAGLAAYCQDRLGSTDRSSVLFHRLVGGLLVDSFRQSVLPQTPVASGNASEVASASSASMPEAAFRSNVQRWLASLTISQLRRDLNQKLNEVAVEFL